MRGWRPLALLAALAAPALPVAAAAQPAEAAPRDWTDTIEATSEGGYRMGNPAARLRLVEYVSISCSHCADFSVEAAGALRSRYIRGGALSWEIRPFLIFPSDPGIFMLLACRGPREYFKLTERLFASHGEWSERLSNVSEEQIRELGAMSPVEQAGALARIVQADEVMRRSGMAQADIDRCLADEAGLTRLAEVTRAGTERHGVQGTPTFFIDGERLDVGDWRGLEPRLAAAME